MLSELAPASSGRFGSFCLSPGSKLRAWGVRFKSLGFSMLGHWVEPHILVKPRAVRLRPVQGLGFKV